MSWKKTKDLVVSVRTYTDSEGKQKNQYKNIGAILSDDQGNQMIMLDRSFNPAGVPFREGSERIIINQFDAKESEKPAQMQEHAKKAASGPETGDIPFD